MGNPKAYLLPITDSYTVGFILKLPKQHCISSRKNNWNSGWNDVLCGCFLYCYRNYWSSYLLGGCHYLSLKYCLCLLGEKENMWQKQMAEYYNIYRNTNCTRYPVCGIHSRTTCTRNLYSICILRTKKAPRRFWRGAFFTLLSFQTKIPSFQLDCYNHIWLHVIKGYFLQWRDLVHYFPYGYCLFALLYKIHPRPYLICLFQ